MLDPALVDQAAEIFGTATVTETVQAALEDAIRRSRRHELAAYRVSDSLAEGLDELRAPRTFSER
jgi:Arc/MetJ family transcription regulator